MKTKAILLFLALIFHVTSHLSGQTKFKVCNTKVAKKLVKESKFKEILDQKVQNINDADWSNDPENPKANRIVEDYAQKTNKLIGGGIHPFAHAVALAHNEHRPLTISPDMIWLLIMQGFAQHIDKNGDSLRHLFVDFEGKKMLNIRMDELRRGDSFEWEAVFANMEEQIDLLTHDELNPLLDMEFSTSTEIEKAAFRITVMDAMSSFFYYSGTVMCGIPEITLEGTTEDWLKIENLVADLSHYGMDWWVEPLVPILHEFVKTSEGNFDRKFWAKIYDENHEIEDVVCAKIPHDYISGWLLNFFPYIKGQKNPLLDKANKRKSKVEIEDLPQGLSKAIFLLDNNGTYHNMEFIAGFMGIKQNHETMALKPEISWAVIDTQTKPADDLLKSYLEFQKQLKEEN